MPNLGTTEIIIIALVVIVLFGSKKLPDAARSIGRSLRIFKAETKGLRGDDDAAQAAQGPAPATVPAPPAPAPHRRRSPSSRPRPPRGAAGARAHGAQAASNGAAPVQGRPAGLTSRSPSHPIVRPEPAEDASCRIGRATA
jgi:sec-independent protein translocase protein TatA